MTTSRAARLPRWPLAAALALGAAACGTGPATAVPRDARADAGAALESGADATAAPDAAAGEDAGAPPLDAERAADARAGADAAAPADAAPPADAGAPIVAPPRAWTWVDVDGAVCGDGSPTGVGVNLVDDSDDVLIFLQGGGACWDGPSCFGPVSTAFYVATGYNRAAFATDVLRPALLPLRRDDPNNPFRRMNIVYVPYCTGDVHGGDRVARYEYLGAARAMHHVGARNLARILARVVPTFPRARRVWLAGDSAGGFGAAVNMERVQDAFPAARVDVLDDSGQPVEPAAGRWPEWRAAWNLQVPAGCPECADDVRAFVRYYQRRFPGNRFGLVSWTHDSVISAFMGLTAFEFNRRLTAFADDADDAWRNGRYYFLLGGSHVGLATPTPGLIAWIEAMVSDDPHWASRRF